MNKKSINIFIIIITVIIAGVAIYTALRLYRSGSDPVAPTAPGSQPFAWDCKNYVFDLTNSGQVTVTNNSDRSEPSQKAEVFINGQLVQTFDVPALTPRSSDILGDVSIPTEPFNWQIVGTIDCSNSGKSQGAPLCKLLTFIVEDQPSPTPTPTGTLSPTPTATITPTGTLSPTPTGQASPTPTTFVGGGPSSTPTNTPAPTNTNAPSPTPTTGTIAQSESPTPTRSGDTGGTGDQQLPDAGFDKPIIFFGLSSILLIIGALILAL